MCPHVNITRGNDLFVNIFVDNMGEGVIQCKPFSIGRSKVRIEITVVLVSGICLQVTDTSCFVMRHELLFVFFVFVFVFFCNALLKYYNAPAHYKEKNDQIVSCHSRLWGVSPPSGRFWRRLSYKFQARI